MKKKTHKHQIEIPYIEPEYDPCHGESMTVQGDALTTEKLVEMYTRGVPVPMQPVTYHDIDINDDDAFIKPGIDLSQVARLRAVMQEKLRIAENAEMEQQHQQQQNDKPLE